MSTINRVAHGLTANQRVTFSAITPASGTGIDTDTIYFVVSAGLTANTFQISETEEGTPLTILLPITAMSMLVVPETTDSDPSLVTYAAEADPTVWSAPPTVVPAPSAPTVTSSLISGIVRLKVTLNGAPEDKIRLRNVQVTSKFDGTGAPEWNTATDWNLPEGSTEISMPALGSTIYAVRVGATDVYGNTSATSPEVLHTTLAGADSLSAALALLANSVSDGAIVETSILPGSITTPLLAARAVTADILAATIVLTSLLKTAETGRRIEIDIDGIRLYDASEALVVRIPTNGDPVYVKGEVSADSLISQTAATFRTAISFDGSSVSTLQNGIATPTVAPTLAASVDVLTLTTTPSGVSTAAGIAYDSAAGTFWLACDPTVSPYYVAQEFNATTGDLVRSISATGSITTTTTTLGSTSKVTDSADGVTGSTNSHFTTPLTIPSGLDNVRITKVSCYLAGRLGTASCRNGVWSTSNIALRESATYTAADKGATGVGNSVQYDKSLSSELTVTAGTTYRVGFRHTIAAEGIQFDKDDGAGKTTYSGDGTTDDGTGWGTYDSAGKPNVYITYKYDTDTRLETAPNIAIATDGTYIYTLDTLGKVWKYLRATGAYVAVSSVQTAITGTKTKAGMFYDATAVELIITTTTGTGLLVYPKFVRVSPSTLAVSTSVYSAAAGTTFNGSTDTFRGGARLADPLNASAATYWVATTSAVYAYTFAGTVATQTANRDFGQSTTVGDGLTHDGTVFRGYDNATPTKLWKFSNWDFTTASSKLWVGYAWYDSVVTTHETTLGPRSSLTIRRRERVLVQQPAIPTGGAEDPNSVRIYMLQNATDTGAGTFWLHITDALTSRYATSYTASGTADGTGLAFTAGVAAELKSAGTGFTLKGSGLINRVGSAFPASPVAGDTFYRVDHGMEFYYDGTRWYCTCGHEAPFRQTTTTTEPVTATATARWHAVLPTAPGLDILATGYDCAFLVVTGGTALGASHKWVLTLSTQPAGTLVSTLNIDSGASNTWRAVNDTGDDVIDATSSQVAIEMTATKTGTPGNLTFVVSVTYRYIAT